MRPFASRLRCATPRNTILPDYPVCALLRHFFPLADTIGSGQLGCQGIPTEFFLSQQTLTKHPKGSFQISRPAFLYDWKSVCWGIFLGSTGIRRKTEREQQDDTGVSSCCHLQTRSRPVSRVLSRTVIHLGRVSPRASSDLPGSSAGHTIAPLFGLAPGGVYRAAACCHPRGALLPHLFTLAGARRRLGGMFSVALSVGSRPPGVTWHPAQWSPDFPPPANRQRLFGRLRGGSYQRPVRRDVARHH